MFVLPSDTEETYKEKISAIQNTPPQPDKEAFACLKELYDIEPLWVPVIYSNEGLSFFEAGCTWMDGDAVWIQLKKDFEKKKTLFALYKKSEVLAHEYVHAVRYPMMSEKYEEFFAYFASKKFGARFRAFFGPLFSSPIEARVFLWAWMLPLFAITLELFDVINSLLCVAIASLPLLLTTFFGVRLILRWKRWQSCRKKVSLPLMVRLTDEEIELFSLLCTEEIALWIEKERENSFRWKLLSDSYFPNFARAPL